MAFSTASFRPLVFTKAFPPVAWAICSMVPCSSLVCWKNFVFALAKPLGFLFMVEPLCVTLNMGATIRPRASMGYTATWLRASRSTVSLNSSSIDATPAKTFGVRAPEAEPCVADAVRISGSGRMFTGNEPENQIRFLRPGSALM